MSLVEALHNTCSTQRCLTSGAEAFSLHRKSMSLRRKHALTNVFEETRGTLKLARLEMFYPRCESQSQGQRVICTFHLLLWELPAYQIRSTRWGTQMVTCPVCKGHTFTTTATHFNTCMVCQLPAHILDSKRSQKWAQIPHLPGPISWRTSPQFFPSVESSVSAGQHPPPPPPIVIFLYSVGNFSLEEFHVVFPLLPVK